MSLNKELKELIKKDIKSISETLKKSSSLNKIVADFDWLDPSIICSDDSRFERVDLRKLYELRVKGTNNIIGVTYKNYLKGIEQVLKEIDVENYVSEYNKKILKMVRTPYRQLLK